MDVALTLWAMQQDREAEIAHLRLVAAVASERVCSALGWSQAPPARSCEGRGVPGISSLFAWARQIRSGAC